MYRLRTHLDLGMVLRELVVAAAAAALVLEPTLPSPPVVRRQPAGASSEDQSWSEKHDVVMERRKLASGAHRQKSLPLSVCPFLVGTDGEFVWLLINGGEARL